MQGGLPRYFRFRVYNGGFNNCAANNIKVWGILKKISGGTITYSSEVELYTNASLIPFCDSQAGSVYDNSTNQYQGMDCVARIQGTGGGDSPQIIVYLEPATDGTSPTHVCDDHGRPPLAVRKLNDPGGTGYRSFSL
jgi:hypothetical protein